MLQPAYPAVLRPRACLRPAVPLPAAHIHMHMDLAAAAPWQCLLLHCCVPATAIPAALMSESFGKGEHLG